MYAVLLQITNRFLFFMLSLTRVGSFHLHWYLHRKILWFHFSIFFHSFINETKSSPFHCHFFPHCANSSEWIFNFWTFWSLFSFLDSSIRVIFHHFFSAGVAPVRFHHFLIGTSRFSIKTSSLPSFINECIWSIFEMECTRLCIVVRVEQEIPYVQWWNVFNLVYLL